jgi:hypothetical protein
MTEELFGCKPKTLYGQTGGKEGSRSTLPFIGSESLYRR